jgi:uncharacterized membrane protein
MRYIDKLPAFTKLVLLLIVFVVGMIIARIGYSSSLRFIYLLWNLFLGWIPLQLSIYLSKRHGNKWKDWIIFLAWLLFFPNALYIVTDLIHLKGHANVPIWYDAILLFTCAITGLLLAFASLYRIEIFLMKKINKAGVNKVIVLVIFLGSFGVYLGRFLRVNSWDVIVNPFELLNEIWIRLLYPFKYYRTWVVTLLLTVLFNLLYFGLKNMPTYAQSLKR